MASYVEGKSKEEILKEMLGTAQPGSAVHEQQKAAITVRCTQDLEAALSNLKTAMETNAASSDKLARRVFWLNAVLTAATVLLALMAVLTFLEPAGQPGDGDGAVNEAIGAQPGE